MDIDRTQTIFDTTPVTICGDDSEYKPDIPDHVYLSWDDICEAIGDPEKWPSVMRTLFWEYEYVTGAVRYYLPLHQKHK